MLQDQRALAGITGGQGCLSGVTVNQLSNGSAPPNCLDGLQQRLLALALSQVLSVTAYALQNLHFVWRFERPASWMMPAIFLF
jgi:hypothetical protein